MKRIINVETGEVIERELNAEELTQEAIDEAKYLQLKEAELEKELARQAVLDKLGISEDEARLLLS